MNLTTFYLRFPSETEAQSVLEPIGIFMGATEGNPGQYKQADIGWSFDPIGLITRAGVYDPDTGDELEPPVVLEGWHANYIGETLPPELEPFALATPPANPYRRFAGF